MKNTTTLIIAFSGILLFGLFCLPISSCKKDLHIEDPGGNPGGDTSYFIVEGITFTNGEITPGYASVRINASCKGFFAESFTVEDHGHVLSKETSQPTVENNNGQSHLNALTGAGTIISNITGLEPGTVYYARIYFKKKDKATGEISYDYAPASKILSFKTLDPEVPQVTDTVMNATSGSFQIEGKILDFKGLEVLQHGFIWSSIHASPDSLIYEKSDGKLEYGSLGITASYGFSAVVQGLEPATTYYARAFAQNQFGFGYGKVRAVATAAAPMPLVGIESVSLFSDANNSGEPNPGEEVIFNVTLKNMGEAVAKNVNVDFDSDDVLILSAEPISFGDIIPGQMKVKQVQLQVSSLASPGDVIFIKTDIACDNHTPWIDNFGFSFEVKPSPAPNVKVQDVTLFSDANNSGEPNPGEDVIFSISLKNTGEATAQNSKVDFSSNDVSIISGEPLSFGDILPGQTKVEQVQLQVSSVASVGNIIFIKTEITCDNHSPWVDNSTFSFVVAAPPVPNIIIQSIDITDDDNNSGEANPGETVTYSIQLKNTGELEASNVETTFSANSSLEFLSTQPLQFGDILPNATKTKELQVKVSNDAFWGQIINVTSTIQSGQFQWIDQNSFKVEVLTPFVVTNGLAFYLRFTDCSGNVVDDLTSNNYGDMFGAEFSSDIIPGTTGCSVNFNSAESDYIQFPQNPISGFTTGSFSFWAKTLTSSGMIFHSNADNCNGSYLRIWNNKIDGSDNALKFNYDISSFLDNSWHHFVISVGQNGNSTLYIDGMEKASNSDDQIYGVNGLGCLIGKYCYVSSSYPAFNGKLDNFRIYNYPLTLAQVQQIFNAKQ